MGSRILIAAWALLIFSTTALAQNQTVVGASAPPNIVLFIADDLGVLDIGPYVNVVVCTPNLDRLAGESLLFTLTSLGLVREVLAGRVPACFQALSLAYGPDWILGIEGVRREDVE